MRTAVQAWRALVRDVEAAVALFAMFTRIDLARGVPVGEATLREGDTVPCREMPRRRRGCRRGVAGTGNHRRIGPANHVRRDESFRVGFRDGSAAGGGGATMGQVFALSDGFAVGNFFSKRSLYLTEIAIAHMLDKPMIFTVEPQELVTRVELIAGKMPCSASSKQPPNPHSKNPP